jgi:hypothetical protein
MGPRELHVLWARCSNCGEVGVFDERCKARPRKRNGIRAFGLRVGLWGRWARSLNGFS